MRSQQGSCKSRSRRETEIDALASLTALDEEIFLCNNWIEQI